jgi:hypothetical protein
LSGVLHSRPQRKIREEVFAYALRVTVLHPVIEFLVVAKIKTLLLEFPFNVPVGFGDELEPPCLLLTVGITMLQ